MFEFSHLHCRFSIVWTSSTTLLLQNKVMNLATLFSVISQVGHSQNGQSGYIDICTVCNSSGFNQSHLAMQLTAFFYATPTQPTRGCLECPKTFRKNSSLTRLMTQHWNLVTQIVDSSLLRLLCTIHSKVVVYSFLILMVNFMATVYKSNFNPGYSVKFSAWIILLIK